MILSMSHAGLTAWLTDMVTVGESPQEANPYSPTRRLARRLALPGASLSPRPQLRSDGFVHNAEWTIAWHAPCLRGGRRESRREAFT